MLSGQAEDAAPAQEEEVDNMEPESKKRKTDDGKFCYLEIKQRFLNSSH